MNRPQLGASVADIGYLAIYPLSLVALLSLARRQLGRLDLRLGIDMLIGALALLAFIGGRLLATTGNSGGVLAAAVSVAYPVGDLLLVALAIAIGSAHRWRLERLWLVLMSGFGVTVTGELLYAADLAGATTSHSATASALWSCGVALSPARAGSRRRRPSIAATARAPSACPSCWRSERWRSSPKAA